MKYKCDCGHEFEYQESDIQSHYLMCGDSTKIEDVEKLMDGKKADMVFTDPPYGVSYGDKNLFLNAVWPANRIQENIDNDTKTVKEMKDLWTQAFTNCNVFTKDGGAYYGCSPQGGELMMMMMSWLEAGWELKQQIIWVKNNIVLGRSDYHYKHEPILYGWKTGKAHQFYGGTGENTVWEINKPQVSDLHPTMKPVALVLKAIKNSSKEEDIILDLFMGSGTTIIASEQSNRIAYGMELDPHYCDVIRKRYAKVIGKEEEWQTITPIIK
ncbi:MAG: DNA modification methylase [Candidatus Brocadia sp. WS118]|nr:MAG: DNA modification methylase [Candidatus Brocadia sp. WS118]